MAVVTKKINITEARRKLMQLGKDAKEGKGSFVEITSMNESVLALIPWEYFLSLIETLEITSDSELMNSIKTARDQSEGGNFITLSEYLSD
ncbi:MAG TPA: hypothetical protein PKV16_02585 [Caldisericia bacterium]|nr:hypothetical protein [Caldisericia bacterium]HPF48200.1 hypothetical protein [Caldisericia bacterium]HPI83864.1 hypothetical protein [Caldisericia bacterium]HPQ92653.1 hypothetical protein [Caldisericia bacterium]HRV74249.1 hypothetical protein [Caldisericia bacterium]